VNINDPLPDCICHVEPEEKERDKVKERGPDHGVLRGKDAGGNNGRDGVRRIVEPVQEIEREGEQDKKKDPSGHDRPRLRRV